jgi:DNA-binding LytR/AlgR family response regulator
MRKGMRLRFVGSKLMARKKSKPDFNQKVTTMNSALPASHPICFPYKGGKHMIPPSQIIRIEATSNYSIIYREGQRPIMMAKVLRTYETILAPFGFLRTHRSHLINPDYIRQILSHDILQMKDESEVLISRRKRNEVLRQTITL